MELVCRSQKLDRALSIGQALDGTPCVESVTNQSGEVYLDLIRDMLLGKTEDIPAGIRTQDLWIRSPTRYPLRYRDCVFNDDFV